MKKIVLIVAVALMAVACSSVMFTGRKQVKLISSSEMSAMAFDSYSEFLSANALSTNAEYQSMLSTVGEKMQVAVEAYMIKEGHEAQIASLDWEFNVVESDEINAWAMPGGKIVFYSGIMPVCKDEQGIAVVMGHEIAHVLAQHGNERMSQQMVAQYGSAALGEFMNAQPEKTQYLYNTAFAVGAQYGALLPFSRLHEREADKIGQIIMAMAGYDPAHAVTFWKDMNAMSSGASTPEFMSTHPSYDTRIQVLTDNIAPARKYLK